MTASESPAVTKLIRESTASIVHEAVAAQARGDIKAKSAWDVRSRYLRKLSARFQSLSDPAGRAVFVSYSVNAPQVYFELLSRTLREANFEVVTGFHQHPGDQDNVLTRVRSQISRCHVYVAILTRELQVLTTGGERRWAPSVWTIEEKGMALGLEKPFVLMVEEGMHEDFWRKTTPGRVHYMFNSGNAMDVTQQVRDAVTERYIEQALRAGSGA